SISSMDFLLESNSQVITTIVIGVISIALFAIAYKTKLSKPTFDVLVKERGQLSGKIQDGRKLELDSSELEMVRLAVEHNGGSRMCLALTVNGNTKLPIERVESALRVLQIRHPILRCVIQEEHGVY